MGTFLVKQMKYKENTISLYGAESNVRPLHFRWSNYESNRTDLFFYDLIAGTIKFKYSNEVSNKINSVIDKITEIHKEKYPKCDEEYGIGDYSLYSMLKTHNTDKEQELNSIISNLDCFIESYKKEKIETHRLYTEKWEEFKDHVSKLYLIFLNEITK